MQTALLKRIPIEVERHLTDSKKSVDYFSDCYFEWKRLCDLEETQKLEEFEKRHGVSFVQILVFYDNLVKA